MGRTFKIHRKYYGEDYSPIFKKSEIEIEPGLTVFVGCNGSGKTTLLKQIKSILNNSEEKIPFLYYDNYNKSLGDMQSKFAYVSDYYSFLAKASTSSEGERITEKMKKISTEMGALVRANQTSKEYWFLFDAIDSGLSIDSIVELKDGLFKFVINKVKDKDIYVIVCTNAFEFANNEKCFDVVGGKYIPFKDYNEYKDFILKSAEIKYKRYKKDNEMYKKKNGEM